MSEVTESNTNTVDKVEAGSETKENKVRELHIADRTNVLGLAENEDLEGDLKEIYDLVKIKVKQLVATGKLTSDHVRPLVLNIVEIVQEYTDNKYDHIDGAQKKAIALNVLRHVIVDLYNNKQLTQDNYELIMLSLEFFGSALIDLGKQAYKLLVNVVEDVAENGCAGCFKRNFGRRN